MKQDERRRHPRYPANQPVRLRRAGEPEAPWSEGILLSISEGGAFVSLRARPERGEPVELELPVAGDVIRAVGEVKWRSERRPVGVGLRFAGLTAELRQVILRAARNGVWLNGPARDVRDADGEQFFLAEDLLSPLDDL